MREIGSPLARKNLHELSRLVYHDDNYKSNSVLHKRLRFVARCLRRYPSFKALVSFFDRHDLQFIVEHHPRILEKIFRPYLYKETNHKKRVQLICQHYYFLSKKLNKAIIERIYSDTALTLFSFTIELDDDCSKTFHINLHYQYQFEKEGEMLLVLQQADGERIYSVAFSIIGEIEKPELVIGGIQGPSATIDERELIIRKLTRQRFGLRPKSLMIELISMLAAHWNCQRILAVTMEGHVYQRVKHHLNRIKNDYDSFWMECQGIPHGENFIRLPVQIERKPLEVIKSKKRNLYRQRYQWLDQINHAIQETLR